MNTAVIGDGGWGTALALLLLENGHEVTLWSPFSHYAEILRKERANPLYLPGIALPNALKVTVDPAEAAQGVEAVILAVPSRYYAATLAKFRGHFSSGVLAVSVAKGFDPENGSRLSETAERVLGLPAVVVLSGPSHAEEVARGLPTAVVAACRDRVRAEKVQQLLMSRRFRVYTSDDPVGVEMGGALKNVIAIAVGICDGLGLGDNARAALITRGLAEMTRLGVSCGADPVTFAGLSGLGDLVVTCTSRLSRNRGVGERLGRGESLATILAGMKQVAEGVPTCPTALALAQRHGIETPIIREVHAILHEGRRPEDVIELLMARPAKPERN